MGSWRSGGLLEKDRWKSWLLSPVEKHGNAEVGGEGGGDARRCDSWRASHKKDVRWDDVRRGNDSEEEANYPPELARNEGLIIAGKLPPFDSHAFNGAPQNESWVLWLLSRDNRI